MKHYYDKDNKELNRYVIIVPIDGELWYFKRYAKTETEAKSDFLSFLNNTYKVFVKPEEVTVAEDPSFPMEYNGQYKNEGMKMSNFLYKLFILFFAVLMTIIMLPVTFAIMIIEWMCGIFVSSEDEK